MKYVCSICGYVYDEAKEAVAFADLPESWVCPLCGAAKALFTPETETAMPAAETPVNTAASMPTEPLTIAGQALAAGELAALCSNLARGCEKQYLMEESALFQELATYFTAHTSALAEADLSQLLALLEADLAQGYPAVTAAAVDDGDRGTQRVCVWGEKVTRILHSLLARYQREGEAFLQDTPIWVCSICGFVYVGETPPEICPVCKVPAWKFEQIEGGISA